MERKRKQELTLWIIGVLLLSIVLWYSVFLIQFIISGTARGLKTPPLNPGAVRFNLEKADEVL